MHQQAIENKILTPGIFDQWLHEVRPGINKLVFTNGCFDIIHRGHVSYLAKAADMGSHLIVAINSDASVKRIKGKNRPLQDEKSRALVMAAMEFVDFVVLFGEDTPAALIEKLVPDVLVKGGDYDIEKIVGHNTVIKAGGEVKTIDFLEGYSSSGIIENLL
ncbi:MAG: D-glycero-beta-D-manno-heptose 1-phosphate adenylyltransferase [Bacteroidales bacterium]